MSVRKVVTLGLVAGALAFAGVAPVLYAEEPAKAADEAKKDGAKKDDDAKEEAAPAPAPAPAK